MERTSAINKDRLFTVYSQKLAGQLMIKGFRLVDIDRNYRYPSKNVFLFDNTDVLRKAIKEYNQGKKEVVM